MLKMAAWFLKKGILKVKGLSARKVNTLMQTRKPVTRAIYSKVWKRFNLWLLESSMIQADSPTIMKFLQNGLEKGLALNYITMRIAALSTYLQRALQNDPPISRFCNAKLFQGVDQIQGVKFLLGIFP